MFVRSIAANLRLSDEQVCMLMTEGGPVFADHLHRDQVVGGGRESAGLSEQSVGVMLPPGAASLRYGACDMSLPAECKKHPRPEGFVLQPEGALVDGGACGEDDGQPLRDPGGGGHQGVVGVRGEAGAEGCEDRHSAEQCATPRTYWYKILE